MMEEIPAAPILGGRTLNISDIPSGRIGIDTKIQLSMSLGEGYPNPGDGLELYNADKSVQIRCIICSDQGVPHGYDQFEFSLAAGHGLLKLSDQRAFSLTFRQLVNKIRVKIVYQPQHTQEEHYGLSNVFTVIPRLYGDSSPPRVYPIYTGSGDMICHDFSIRLSSCSMNFDEINLRITLGRVYPGNRRYCCGDQDYKLLGVQPRFHGSDLIAIPSIIFFRPTDDDLGERFCLHATCENENIFPYTSPPFRVIWEDESVIIPNDLRIRKSKCDKTYSETLDSLRGFM